MTEEQGIQHRFYRWETSKKPIKGLFDIGSTFLCLFLDICLPPLLNFFLGSFSFFFFFSSVRLPSLNMNEPGQIFYQLNFALRKHGLDMTYFY